jgi:putative copper export protein
VLPVDDSTIRVFLHVFGAMVWVGGQFSLGFLVPVLRREAGTETVRAAARRFQLVAWPAFGLLLATGIWNLVEMHVADQDSEYLRTLFVKLVLVALSGVTAAGHALLVGPAVARAADDAQQRRRRAFSGALAGLALLSALGAAFMGVVLGG